MAHIHRIGVPENESESLAIRTLAEVLPDDYLLFHNFEVTTGRGLPYEFDILLVAEFALWHIEVKGYRGPIRGDRHNWIFSNGHVQPSPIPLANKKTRILASKLKKVPELQGRLFIDTAILLSDSKRKPELRDEQADRVILLKEARQHFTDRRRLPVSTPNVAPLVDVIRRTMQDNTRAGKRVKGIGLYDVVERINQTDTRTVFLAKHRHISTAPKTILKVFHFDVYANAEEKERQVSSIFHDQDAMRLLGSHPNVIRTGDMFAWGDDQFVLPTEYIERAQPLLSLLEEDSLAETPRVRRYDWIQKIARALKHAHAHGVIYRDLKPLNVVIGPNGICKIVNFDLALVMDRPELGESRVPQLRERLESEYVAPEVWRDPRAADCRSDVFSLGVLFYRLMTGHLPDLNAEELLKSKVASAVDRDRLMSACEGEGLPRSAAELVDVVERMTMRAPSKRYSTMGQVIRELCRKETLDDGGLSSSTWGVPK